MSFACIGVGLSYRQRWMLSYRRAGVVLSMTVESIHLKNVFGQYAWGYLIDCFVG